MNQLYLLDEEIKSIVSEYSLNKILAIYPIIDSQWQRCTRLLPLDIQVIIITAHNKTIRIHRITGSQKPEYRGLFYQRYYVKYALRSFPADHIIWKIIKPTTTPSRHFFKDRTITVEYIDPIDRILPVEINCEDDKRVASIITNAPSPSWVLKKKQDRANKIKKEQKEYKKLDKSYIFRDLIMPLLSHVTMRSLRCVCKTLKEIVETTRCITIPILRFMDGKNPWNRFNIKIEFPQLFFKLRLRTYLNAYPTEIAYDDRIKSFEKIMIVDDVIVIYAPDDTHFKTGWNTLVAQNATEETILCILRNMYG